MACTFGHPMPDLVQLSRTASAVEVAGAFPDAAVHLGILARAPLDAQRPRVVPPRRDIVRPMGHASRTSSAIDGLALTPHSEECRVLHRATRAGPLLRAATRRPAARARSWRLRSLRANGTTTTGKTEHQNVVAYYVDGRGGSHRGAGGTPDREEPPRYQSIGGDL